MAPSETVGYLSLGSNVEPREDYLRRALAELDRSAGLRLLRVSSFYVTAPWGGVPQADFYNLAAAVATTLAPRELLAICQKAEDRLGRRRDGPRWGPREIDIDILLLGDIIWHDESLTIPHPFLTERAFVLTPLREITPDLRLPGGELLAGWEGTGRARKLEKR